MCKYMSFFSGVWILQVFSEVLGEMYSKAQVPCPGLQNTGFCIPPTSPTWTHTVFSQAPSHWPLSGVQVCNQGCHIALPLPQILMELASSHLSCLCSPVLRMAPLIFFFFFCKFYFIFKLYIIVLVLPNIKMNPPQVYMWSEVREHESSSYVLSQDCFVFSDIFWNYFT